MDAQKAGDLLQDLKAELDQLEKATTDAERRRDIALSQANNLEVRNRQAIEQIEQEVQTKRKALEKELDQVITELSGKIRGLEKTKKQLLTETETLKVNKQQAQQAFNSSEGELLQAQKQVNECNAKTDELEARIIQKRAALAGYAEKLEIAKKLVAEEQYRQSQLEKDSATLQAMVDKLENDIMDNKGQYDLEKKTLNNQLADKQQQLKTIEAQLAEALRTDKSIRQAWAEEHLKLEKRTLTVRNMEAAVSDAESRVSELDKFMRL